TDPDAPFLNADPALATPVDLQGAGWIVGLVAGILLEPHERIAIGASVHTPSTSRARGSVAVEYPAAMRSLIEDSIPSAELPDLTGDVEADLTMPLTVFTAVSVRPAEPWELRVDYRFPD